MNFDWEKILADLLAISQKLFVVGFSAILVMVTVSAVTLAFIIMKWLICFTQQALGAM